MTPFSLTPVSNRNELPVLCSDLGILIKAENPCSATGGGSTNLSFFINGGLIACSEFVNKKSVELSIRIIIDIWSIS